MKRSWPLVMRQAATEQRLRDAVAAISDVPDLPPQERAATIPSGQTTLIASRVKWAITNLVRAGLLERPRRGHFLIAEAGRRALEDTRRPVDLAFLETLPDFVAFIQHRGRRALGEAAPGKDTASGDQSPEEMIGRAMKGCKPT